MSSPGSLDKSSQQPLTTFFCCNMPYGLPAAALCGLCKQMEALDTMGGVALAYDL